MPVGLSLLWMCPSLPPRTCPSASLRCSGDLLQCTLIDSSFRVPSPTDAQLLCPTVCPKRSALRQLLASDLLQIRGEPSRLLQASGLQVYACPPAGWTRGQSSARSVRGVQLVCYMPRIRVSQRSGLEVRPVKEMLNAQLAGCGLSECTQLLTRSARRPGSRRLGPRVCWKRPGLPVGGNLELQNLTVSSASE